MYYLLCRCVCVCVCDLLIFLQASVSPFDESPEWNRAEFRPEAATSRSISETLGAMGPWLERVDSDGDGFLFRHGWMVKLLLGEP